MARTGPADQTLPLSELGLDASQFPSSEGKTVHMGGGRVLGYEEYGSVGGRNAENLIFCHGNPGTRFAFSSSGSEACAAKNVRVFVVERPGFGLSTQQHNFTILSFARDLEFFASSLGLHSFSVIGFNFGAAYALACASLGIPGLKKVIIVSPAAPPGTPVNVSELSVEMRRAHIFFKHCKCCLAHVLRENANQFMQNPRIATRDIVRKVFAQVDASEFEQNTEFERMAIKSSLELYSRPSGVTSVVRDHKLILGNWGFDLKSLHDVQISMYSGALDRVCVPSIISHLASVIPWVSNHVIPDRGHFVFLYIWDRILEELTSA
eukprot:977024_1